MSRGPLTDPAYVQQLVDRAKAAVPAHADSLSWARELRRRELRCERLSKAQREAWRVALRRELESTP